MRLNTLKKGLRKPKAIPGYLKNKLLSYKIRYYLEGYKQYRPQEFENIKSLMDDLKRQTNNVEHTTGGINLEQAQQLYNLIRQEKPDLVVETGVSAGVSSAIILKALEENGKGELYSIDLPIRPDEEETAWHNYGGTVIPPDQEPGWAIPKELKQNWTLIKGDSNYELPKLLRQLGEIGIFIHDSEHSYQTMMLEYCLAWKHLQEKGFLLSHDINATDAFNDFSRNQEGFKNFLTCNLGLLKKEKERL